MTHPSPQWPALIHYQGDAELEFITEATAFSQWHAGATTMRLIDSRGQIFELGYGKTLSVMGHATLDEILNLIRHHALLEGVCCTPKLGAQDIPTAMTILASLVRT